ncbi:MAG: 3-isopropylmalate dehydrogenase [Betaproteobacteria bacterium TMED156]|nr:MAG: 3-isopropylmalate dehydrogenase [Betaproteobacteria bacterium TMED156]|tara:strand:- start:285 stop:1364 length:1080 start_codon:yes stop_codon:yes gene_type:complete
MKCLNIAVLPGDGIGSEIINEAIKILKRLSSIGHFDLNMEFALVGGSAIKETNTPLPNETLKIVMDSEAILFGAVGDFSFDHLQHADRPEAAILSLRKELKLFANLRPAFVFDELAQASSLKEELVSGLDIMIVRELTGDIYFGEPRGIQTNKKGEKIGINTMIYNENEIIRIAKVAFDLALKRDRRLVSIDKANVLECMQLWRDTVTEVSKSYPDVELSHLYVDNAAMQLAKNPKQFDVMLTGNIFGDILSDQASMLTGSIGMLPSASINDEKKGLYEPVHGSAPDIAGKNISNPLATILSISMMLRITFDLEEPAKSIELAVKNVLQKQLATPDFFRPGKIKIGTKEMGDAVTEALV